MSKKIHEPKEPENHSMTDLLAEDDSFDADALLADLDKESNVRSYSGTVSKWILRGILVALIGFIFYCIYGYIEERARKSLFLGIILLAGNLPDKGTILWTRNRPVRERTCRKLSLPWLRSALSKATDPFSHCRSTIPMVWFVPEQILRETLPKRTAAETLPR